MMRWRSRCGMAAMAAAAAGSAAGEWDAADRDGLAGRRAPRGSRPPRSTPEFARIFCAGEDGSGANEESDDFYGDQNNQGLWVNQTQAECTAITLPLLAAFLGSDVAAIDQLYCLSPYRSPGQSFLGSNGTVEDCNGMVNRMDAQVGQALVNEFGSFECARGDYYITTADDDINDDIHTDGPPFTAPAGYACSHLVAAVNIAMENCSTAGRLDYLAANCSLQTHCGNSSTKVQPTATDLVCNGPAPPPGGSSSAPLSTGDTVLIVLAVLIAVVVIAYLLSRQRGLTKVLEHNETLHEQLLEEHKEQRGDLEG